MLNEAGYDFSKELVIAYYYDDQTTTDIMAMIKQDFATAGITVVPKLLTGDLVQVGTEWYRVTRAAVEWVEGESLYVWAVLRREEETAFCTEEEA